MSIIYILIIPGKLATGFLSTKKGSGQTGSSVLIFYFKYRQVLFPTCLVFSEAFYSMQQTLSRIPYFSFLRLPGYCLSTIL